MMMKFCQGSFVANETPFCSHNASELPAAFGTLVIGTPAPTRSFAPCREQMNVLALEYRSQEFQMRLEARLHCGCKRAFHLPRNFPGKTSSSLLTQLVVSKGINFPV